MDIADRGWIANSVIILEFIIAKKSDLGRIKSPEPSCSRKGRLGKKGNDVDFKCLITPAQVDRLIAYKIF